MLGGKKVLLGVTGSIAAYKSAFLTRLLVKAGAEVKIVLTPAARDFVTPLTLSTLSKNPVLWEYFDPADDEGKWNKHVDLALWADLMIIAPATANTISKMASGAADNFLLGVYLSSRCPIYISPAMDLDMYAHPTTKENLEKLQEFGHKIIPAATGELASGLSGEGRMAEPEAIIEFIENDLRKGLPLEGKMVLINAGPTQEAIDPVRYIGNRSSGRMGIAMAEIAASFGAQVKLVLGPTSLKPSNNDIEVIRVGSAAEMNQQCRDIFPDTDITICSAAVADYRPENPAGSKIKKDGAKLVLKLVENPDILAGLGKIKKSGQLLVGFALETDNAVENAKSKLHKKNCDLIVLNSPSEKGSGFGYDTNEVTMITADGVLNKPELKKKSEIAEDIFKVIINRLLPKP